MQREVTRVYNKYAAFEGLYRTDWKCRKARRSTREPKASGYFDEAERHFHGVARRAQAKPH